MKRRDFVAATGFIAGAGFLPVVSAATLSAPGSTRFQLFPTSGSARSAKSPDVVRVHFDAWVTAKPEPILRRFAVGAQFYPNASPVAYGAWSFNADQQHGGSSRSSIIAGSRILRTLSINYQLMRSSVATREQCLLGQPLIPGSYVLVGPRSDGSLADVSACRANGNIYAPLVQTGHQPLDFDYLAFRIEPA